MRFTNPREGAPWSDSTGTALVRPDGSMASPADMKPMTARPYRLASYGDSRANAHTAGSAIEIGFSGVTSVNKANNKTPMWLEAYLGDAEYCYNFGVSGDTAAGWDSLARTSGKTPIALKDYRPDCVYIQYGINSYAAGTSTAAIVADLQELIAYCLGFGAKVIFEATLIASAANYGASSESKLAATLAGNALMQTFCAGFPDRVCYIDNNAWLADGTGFLSSTYSADGLHLNIDGAQACGVLIAAAAREILPRRDALTYTGGASNAPNLVPWGGAGPSMYTSTSTGTITYSTPTWNIDSVTGEPYAECTMTCTALAGGYASGRLEIHASGISGATPANPILVGDRLQGSARIVMDDGAGGLAGYQTFTFRQRLYSDTKFTDNGGVSAAAVTSKLMNVTGRQFTPTLITATASVGISAPSAGAGFPLQFIVEFNAVSQVCRLRIYSPAIRQVSPVQMPAGITLTASPMTYQNTSNREMDVLFAAGTITALTFNRSGAAAITTGITTTAGAGSGSLRLSPGDGFTMTYTGTPVLSLIPRS